MKIAFTKAQASGNDFIILDNRDGVLQEKAVSLSDFTKWSCRRKFSIGADGVLVLEKSKVVDFHMRILNPDGSEVSMCGNGIRCAAMYAHLNKWCGSAMKIETLAGILEADISGDSVKIKMTAPKNIVLNKNIGVGKSVMNFGTINTGVPHAIYFTEQLDSYPVKEIGGKVRYHKVFEPEGTNVDFVESIDNETIKVRTYERGVEDETLACGTGVVASAIISHLVKGTTEPVKAMTQSGDVLKVYFKKELNAFNAVYLEGKACIAYSGEVVYV